MSNRGVIMNDSVRGGKENDSVSPYFIWEYSLLGTYIHLVVLPKMERYPVRDPLVISPMGQSYYYYYSMMT